ncbi:aminoglycoside phosphotransferase family protein [Rubellimicrobium sp. CFH 75288]|uniref:aminoglycoside phosphotransferase family protein n=1 Tax=Rubellimicrobium sp. CFH 75288 TaxID=2697034 RepID=UPI00141337AE|nr:phosphotransferase [Rubellimicrobium sp. CFH 75288]NAZ37789.1 phosphotransferase [Rubellimicrobium sp. CFH 75288]
MTEPVRLPPDPVAAFLAAGPAAGWRREALAGDASARRYERLVAPDGRTAILMDARREPASCGPFLRIAAHLRGLGLVAPRLLQRGTGPADGLLLVEDLGTETLAARLARRPEEAPHLYAAAVDLLVRLGAAPPPEGLDTLSPARLVAMLEPLWQHYTPGADADGARRFGTALQEALARLAPGRLVLSLRDFHAENLVWREAAQGTGRLGLLDFQDAVLAPPEYDLASLLRDARRDTEAALRSAMTARFAAATGQPRERVEAAGAALGLARNLRILGVFARLIRSGRPGYAVLLPRVWRHVEDDLAHPALAGLAPMLRGLVAPPERTGLAP